MYRSSNAGYLSAAGLAAVWPAIWLCWGPAVDVPPPAARMEMPRVSYIRQAPGAASLPWSPMLIALPSSAGAETAGGDRPHAAWLAPDLGIGPQPIPYRAAAIPPIELALPPAGQRAPAPSLLAARPAPPAFGPAAVSSAGPVIQMSASLASAGFEPAAIPADAGPGAGGRWSVTARVETRADGSVGHVFLENPCQSAALNLTVIRALKQGRVRSGIGPVEGTVSVTWRGAAAGASPE